MKRVSEEFEGATPLALPWTAGDLAKLEKGRR